MHGRAGTRLESFFPAFPHGPARNVLRDPMCMCAAVSRHILNAAELYHSIWTSTLSSQDSRGNSEMRSSLESHEPTSDPRFQRGTCPTNLRAGLGRVGSSSQILKQVPWHRDSTTISEDLLWNLLIMIRNHCRGEP